MNSQLNQQYNWFLKQYALTNLFHIMMVLSVSILFNNILSVFKNMATVSLLCDTIKYLHEIIKNQQCDTIQIC